MKNLLIVFGLFISSLGHANWHNCKPTQVAVFQNRVHVRCAANAPGGIGYFAFKTSVNTEFANRLQALASTAQVSGKTLNIEFDPNENGQSWGCNWSDCRSLSSAIMF